MTLFPMDLVTLIAAALVGGYIVLARRVHLTSHGWGCALWHLAAVALCAQAATDSMHAQSGPWLLGIAAIVVWLIESRHTWDKPKSSRRHEPASTAPARAKERV